jgi:hydrogenase nickel incorporation protein HypA/HybF
VHERALMRDLLARVDEAARAEGATRVTGVRVLVGPLSHLTPEHFREHFADAARGTIAEGARVAVASDAAGADVVLESLEVELP